MKKEQLIICMLTAMLPLQALAQSVTYNHDESVMNQFTIGETGAGSFTPDCIMMSCIATTAMVP